MNFLRLAAILFTISFFTQSCSLFDLQKVSNNIEQEIPKICLSSEGRGRLVVSDHKFVFRFNSALDPESEKWYMSLVFPLYGEETFVVDWSQGKLLSFNASFENKILADKNKVNPEELHVFLEKWAKLIVEINSLKRDASVIPKNSEFDWSSNKKSLTALSTVMNNDKIKLEFKNLTSENYFGRYDVFMQSEERESIKLELIVRKCLESIE
jgi:hypothetical protein